MKRIRSLFFSFLLVFSSFSFSVFANAGGFVPKIPNPSKFNTGEDIINALAGLVRPAFLIGFAAMLFFGAWTYLTAGSDSSKMKNAKDIITAAIGGFILAVLAPTIMNFIGGLLGIQGGLTIL